MVSYLQKLLFIALAIAIAVPSSTGHRRRSRKSHGSDTEKYLRDLCSDTNRSDVCWNILRSEARRFDSGDDGDVAGGVIDLARTKAKEIYGKLRKWHKDSSDEKLKDKYHLCSENYNDLLRDLKEASKKLGSSDHQKILDEIDDAEDELDECRQLFGSGSFDPGHVEDRNDELGVYLDVVRAAAVRLGDQ
ncbi:pectinesterase inhibitor-like [Salvia divinorum]|uniref:Pectinesterase inhibitor-like n=1 Tax=Salvia divinorum TaxID=28513 RepID=A0ABD1G2V1_SALDI